LEQIVRYKASDGQEVELTPRNVLAYIVSGNARPSDKEVMSFIAKCQARGLNPLAGDCYMVTYQDRMNGGTNTSVITSKDYFVRTATQQANFDGMEAGIITWFDNQVNFRTGSFHMPQEQLVGGWARVHVKNWKVPVEAQVMLSEYDTGKKMWKSKPATMIRKVALVQALREAFPVAFGGIYEREEMGDMGEVEPPTYEVPAQAEEVAVEVERDPSEPVNAATAEQKRQINELVTALAKARNVSYAVAKRALFDTPIMRKVGAQGEVKTQRQALAAIGQLNAWMQASAKEEERQEEGKEADVEQSQD
jgi:phage recombination protein Bet